MNSRNQMQRDLDALATRGAGYLRRWALKQATEQSLPGFWRLSLVVPLLVLLVNLAGVFTGQLVWPLGTFASIVVAVLVPLALFAMLVLTRYLGHRIDRRMSLAQFDRALDYRDRLQIADEFLGQGTQGGFEQAAIDDAKPFVHKALGVELQPPDISRPAMTNLQWQPILIALVLLVVGLWLGGQGWAVTDQQVMTEPGTTLGQAIEPFESELREQTDEKQRQQAQHSDSVNESPRLAKNELRGQAEQLQMDPVLNPSSARMSSGSPGSRPQQTKKSQSSSSESGASGKSAGSQKKKEEEIKAKQRKPKEKKDRAADDEEKPSSGVSGGKGGSSGSKSSASDQAGADNRAAQEQDEDDSEGDPEDEEDEEQKAGSSSKPMLNQKKAPVNRSLTPSGLGEGQENPDANGRSGPGGLKKTRGVAAMLLGTPLPDRLRGQPNPGRVKVQRERAQPEEQFADSAVAGDHEGRDEAIGSIAHPTLLPWMRALVRNYFLSGHANETSEGNSTITNTTEETGS